MKNEALLILCWSLLAVPQTALGRSPALSQGEGEEDLSGTWSVTVHFTTSGEGTFPLLYTETHDYKAAITFVPVTTAHYCVAGHVNVAPKTDEEQIYNVYFQSCARREGHDIAKTSPHTYRCSYEYGQASRDRNGIGITTFYNGDLTFELKSGILHGRTRFLIDFRQTDGAMATHSEEAVWTGERQAGRQDCATAQNAVDLLRSRVEADQDRIRGLDMGVAADELNSFANAAGEERHQIVVQSLKSGVSALAGEIQSAPENALKPMDIAGYHLPNGIGSLGTGQAKAIVGRLRSQGVDSPVVFEALQTLSRISGKAGTLEFTNVLSEVASKLKGTAEMGSSEDSVENTAALFQLAADLTGQGSAGRGHWKRDLPRRQE